MAALTQKKHREPIHLVPHENIEVRNDVTIAVGGRAWLRVEPCAAVARHRWMRLRYAASVFDDPARPHIRFRTRGGEVFTLAMNGTVAGAAEWIGRVPDATIEVTISPVRTPGPFAFRLDAISAVSRLDLLWRAWRRSWSWTYWALRSKLLLSRREAWQALLFATEGVSFKRYADWLMRFERPREPNGLDRQRLEPLAGARFVLLMRADGAAPATIQATLESLDRQTYSNWRLGVALAARRPDLDGLRLHPRVRWLWNLGDWSVLLGETSAAARVCVIEPGDRLAPHALALFANEFALEPDRDLVYCDEDVRAADSRPCAPRLKPDWSPVFQLQAPYVGRLACFRAGGVASSAAEFAAFLDNEPAILARLAQSRTARVGHIRRILYHRAAPPPAPAAAVHRSCDRSQIEWPRVATIIPTRDAADLLAACIRSLREKTDYPALDLVIVDNGSAERDARALLIDLKADPMITVLDRPGPFNFSALCNDGARASSAPVLLFLNNDVEALAPGWLNAMTRWAVRSDIGAVGAKLLFPDGTLQHAGVVVGFGGLAGHLHRRMPADTPGHLGRLAVPHEVSAVTGACLAVERTKFDAVGGFDAVNLPIDLNDIDLCLRLSARGWRTLWTPEATLLHRQSATRGIDKDPFVLYRRERTYFAARWIDVIADDRFFHPGLSLFNHGSALAGFDERPGDDNRWT